MQVEVYDRHPHTQMTLLTAMDAAFENITVDACRGCIRHSKILFSTLHCKGIYSWDVDEKLWPERLTRRCRQTALQFFIQCCMQKQKFCLRVVSCVWLFTFVFSPLCPYFFLQWHCNECYFFGKPLVKCSCELYHVSFINLQHTVMCTFVLWNGYMAYIRSAGFWISIL